MSTALYTDLSAYYDLMCADIDYQSQSDCVRRLHHIFGNQGLQHIDLACGTGPHIQYFLQYAYQCRGLDLNQPMLDIAQQRCPQATFTQGNMANFAVQEKADLITCFLYSLHYCQDISMLKDCFKCVFEALSPGGMFCFNSVDKTQIDNCKSEQHYAQFEGSEFKFSSAWHYPGQGNLQSLLLSIDKNTDGQQRSWQDRHSMVALDFNELQSLLLPYFEVSVFQHDYSKLVEWDNHSGNAIFACVKRY